VSETLRISDFVAQHAAARPGAEALVLGELRIDYAEFNRRVEALARALFMAGVRKGDRVATLATPNPDYFVCFLATASIGAIWVGVNPRYRTEELKYIVGDAEPAVLLARTSIEGRSYDDEIFAMRTAAPSIRRVVILNGDPVPIGAESAESFVAAGSAVSESDFGRARAGCGGPDPCLLVYTSGSTGRPKGALLHHQGIIEFSLTQNRLWPLSDTRFLNYFPVNHVGCIVDISCPTLAAGGCIVFMEHFSAEGALHLLQRERVTAWASVPSTFQMQLALPDFARYDLSSVQMIIWEGAAMPREMIVELRRLLPRLASNYGMTETTSAITIVEPTDDVEVLADSVGHAFPGVEVRLVDEHGRSVRPGESGEVQARSIYNMLGYWRRPAETAAAFTADGYFRTGDVAVQRPDGRYKIVGRLKEMYKSGGYNVYPREVEQVIEAHPGVAMAAVVSRPDDLWQEVGVAFIVPHAHVAIAEIERHCRERLANYKIPKEFVLCAELPLLPVGKIDKVALEQRAQGKAFSAPPSDP
jgi:acyl-CoA synthetase (AMP-forming)/AMP-acid ligase II